jgi:hypothetical protein
MGKKKKNKKKKNKKGAGGTADMVADVLKYDESKEYTIPQMETMLDQIPCLTEAIDKDLRAMEAERANFAVGDEAHTIDLLESMLLSHQTRGDLMSTFAHLSLDLGAKHRAVDQERFEARVKAMQATLERELGEKFARLKARLCAQ